LGLRDWGTDALPQCGRMVGFDSFFLCGSVCLIQRMQSDYTDSPKQVKR